MYIPHAVDGHVVCFYLLAIVTSAAMNVGVQLSLRDPAFNCLGYMYTRKWGLVDASYGSFILKYLRDLHYCFP